MMAQNKKLNNKFNLIGILISLSIFYINFSFGQDQGYLEIVGSVNQEKKALDGAEISVMKGNEVVETLLTNSRGNFIVNLELNSSYLVVYRKAGFITKSVEFDTKVPQEYAKQIFSLKYKIDLFEKVDGLPEPSVLSQPVAKYEYSDDYEDFTYDPNYTNTRKEETTKVKQEMQAAVEKQRIEKEKVKAQVKADSLAVVNKARLEQQKVLAQELKVKQEQEAKVKEEARQREVALAVEKAKQDSVARVLAAEDAAKTKAISESKGGLDSKIQGGATTTGFG